jgi:sporulation protein YlmC with PRC-barrel domain
MKKNRTLLVAMVATVSVALQSTAQESGTVAPNHFEKAGNLIGRVITDSRNQHAGRVSELAIDWQAGRIAEVLVDTGGFLTSKQRIVAVPPESFTLTDASAELSMNADIDAFDNAPEFVISMWKETTGSSSVGDVYKRFHVQPHAPPGHLARASKIMGLNIRNKQTQHLGKVEDLVVALPGGGIPAVIIAGSGFLGIKGELTAVPPTAFLFEPDNDALILNSTREALKNAPHFKPGEWRTGVINSINLSAIDDSLKIANRANDSGLQSDVAITLEIEHKILATDGLSMDARHVVVNTRMARVTLRGIADSAREKHQIGDIAASVVPADHVDNQIEVRVFAVVTVQSIQL